jgi:hypothetical protein
MSAGSVVSQYVLEGERDGSWLPCRERRSGFSSIDSLQSPSAVNSRSPMRRRPATSTDRLVRAVVACVRDDTSVSACGTLGDDPGGREASSSFYNNELAGWNFLAASMHYGGDHPLGVSVHRTRFISAALAGSALSRRPSRRGTAVDLSITPFVSSCPASAEVRADSR